MATEKLYWIDSDSNSYQLYDNDTDVNKRTLAVHGLGMPPVNQLLQSYPLLPGGVHLQTIYEPREVILSLLRAGFASRAAFYDDRQSLATGLRTHGKGQLRLTEADGTQWFLDGYVTEGPDLDLVSDLGPYAYKATVTIRCPWPFWRPGSTTSITGTYNGASSVDIVSTISGDIVAMDGTTKIASFAQTVTIDGPSTGTLSDPNVQVVGASGKLDFSLGAGVDLTNGDQLVATCFPFESVTVTLNGSEIDEYTTDSTLVFPLPSGSITIRLDATSGPANNGDFTLTYYPYYLAR